MAEDRKKVIAFHRQQALPVVFSTLPDNLIEILSTNSYQKGAWVLHMLRLQIGDEFFRKGIRQYYKEFQQSNAVTADLQRIMEQVSGQDLSKFFKQWLYTPGHPVVKATWRYDVKTKTIDLSVDQIQKDGLFEFPLEIGIQRGSETVLEKVKIVGKSAKFSIKSEGKPLNIALDPNVNLLFEGNFTN
jgi:aminopeptidase N